MNNSENPQLGGYPLVKVFNSTKFYARGTVNYSCPGVCSKDNFALKSGEKFEATSRGVCLVSKITATVTTPDGDVEAKPYTSAGTTYSKFAVIAVNDGFIVTRITNDLEDLPPADYQEPATMQK